MIRVGIAEDHLIVRQGLVSLIKEQEGMRVLFDVSNGAELLEKLKENTKPDVILLDIEMPAVDGRQALKVISEKYPEIKVIMLSMHSKYDFISECISLGAHGFLSKDCDFEKVVDAIYGAIFKGFYFDDIVSRALVASVKTTSNNVVASQHSNTLDTIDIQIIELVCQGKNSKEIGKIIYLSERTVEGRRLRIAKKTNTENIIELVVFAIKNGIFKIN